MKEYSYLADRYMFITEKEQSQAAQEMEAIEYMKANTDTSEVKNAYGLYKKLNEAPTFQTPVGMEFMGQLFDVCVNSGMIRRENMEPIKVKSAISQQREDALYQTSSVEVKNQEKIAIRYRNLKIVTLGLAVTIGAMFYIAYHSDYSHISDYESRLLDKYSTWEDELREREEIIREREQEVGIVEK